MAAMTYAQLTTALADYTEQSFTNTQLATFVQQAEERIYNTVQLPDLRRNMSGIVQQNNPYLEAPTDFLAAFSLAIVDSVGTYTYLLNKDVNFLREMYPSPTTTGTPRYYAIFGGRSDLAKYLSFMVAPTPNIDYTVELHYFYYPESIVTASTSWLGDNFSSALLYGALVEAYTYMKGGSDTDKPIMDNYVKRYEDALALIKGLGDGKDRQDAYRNGQVRYPVK